MDFYDQDKDESVIDPWGEDDVSMCDCCQPQASSCMAGLAWGVAVVLWVAALAGLLANGLYVAFAAALIAGLVVFVWGLFS